MPGTALYYVKRMTVINKTQSLSDKLQPVLSVREPRRGAITHSVSEGGGVAENTPKDR